MSRLSDIRGGRRLVRDLEPSRIVGLLGAWEIALLVHHPDVDEDVFLEIAVQAVKLLALLHDETPDAVLELLSPGLTEDEWRDLVAWRRAELEREKAEIADG